MHGGLEGENLASHHSAGKQTTVIVQLSEFSLKWSMLKRCGPGVFGVAMWGRGIKRSGALCGQV